MNVILSWLTANPLYAALIWSVITGGASLGYQKLDANTKWHAAFATLAALGIDIPKIIEKLPGLWGGGSGGSGTNGKNADTIPAPEAPKPPAALFIAVGFACLLSCTPAQQTTAVQSGEQVAACVIAQILGGNEDPLAIGASCSGVAIQDIGNIISSFLASGPDGGASTEATTRLLRVKAKLVSDAGGQ